MAGVFFQLLMSPERPALIIKKTKTFNYGQDKTNTSEGKMNDYDKKWEEGEMPKRGDLAGLFDVTILTGLFWPVGKLQKKWQKNMFCHTGYNIQNKHVCGYFYKFKEDTYINLNYDQSKNNWMWRNLNDHVRQITDNYFLGKIYFKFWGKYRFCGYFSLTRIL